jgi:hypothetical protein
MTELFHVVSERLKAIFTAHTALELEAELIAHHIERKATLLKQAAKLEKDGFKDLAEELRGHTAGINPRHPVEAVLPVLSQSLPAPTDANGKPHATNHEALTQPAVQPNEDLPVANGAANDSTPVNNHGVTEPTPETEPEPETAEGRPTGNRRKKSR